MRTEVIDRVHVFARLTLMGCDGNPNKNDTDNDDDESYQPDDDLTNANSLDNADRDFNGPDIPLAGVNNNEDASPGAKNMNEVAF